MSDTNPLWRAGVTQDNRPLSKAALIAGTVGAVVLLLVVVVTVYFFSRYGVFTVASSSMEPTIRNGDRIFCDKWAYGKHSLTKGDVVGFRHNDFVLLKRLVGVAGDRVEGRNGTILVNDVALNEPYAQYTDEMDAPNTFGPTIVAPGQVFLLGDNRNHSLDSRMEDFGTVEMQDIFCKARNIEKSDQAQHVGRIR